VRGTIERVDGDVHVVKARGGTELKVKLAENAMVVALIKASLAAITAGGRVISPSGIPAASAHYRIAFHPAKPRIRQPLAVPSRPAKAA
jgi:hypothetical protein